MNNLQSNADRFLAAYNLIDKVLRTRMGSGRHTGFLALISEAASKRDQAVVRQHQQDLREFAELRNAIVHDSRPDHVIAEPVEWAVLTIEAIAEAIASPATVIPAFQRPVATIQLHDRVMEVARLMWKDSYSQTPVYDGDQFVGLLTTNTLARWLGAAVDFGLADLEETVEQALRHAEDRENYRFIDRLTTVARAEELLLEPGPHGRGVDALLITEHGKPAEKLIGIMTPWDLARARELTRRSST